MARCIITDVRGDIHPAEMSVTMRYLFGWIGEVANRAGMAPPELLSGARTRERQQYLQQQWDRGNRAGLAVRPSSTSKHIPDAMGHYRAFDLANTEDWLYLMGPVVVAKWPNIEWGGTYIPKDIRHFEER